jgi:Ethylbenzene dehydrogenase/Prokaryotic cytochrome b561
MQRAAVTTQGCSPLQEVEARVRPRRTDYGTIILHWLLVAATGVAFFTGLRIAAEAPDRTWINTLDLVLPRVSVWTWHMQVAVVLVAVSIAHAIYLIRSGLSRRVQLDRIRLRGLAGPKQVQLGSISVILTLIFFGSMVTLIFSGGLLYFGVFAGYGELMVHWYASWVVPAFALLHILLHFRIGGVPQLLRIFRPGRLPPPPPKLDAVELLTLLSEKIAAPEAAEALRASVQPEQPMHKNERAPQDERKIGADAPGRRGVTLQSNPFGVAAAIAIAGASAVVATDWLAVDSLQVHRIASADAPSLDGDTSDPVWRAAQPFSLMTNQGGNFNGRGESRVDIRAVHDDTWAYFLFTWEDPTRSLKQLPLIKQADGWHLLHDGYEKGDERSFNEDKFAVLLTTSDVDLAGDRTFHASPQPIPGAPATMTGRGLHYTTNATYADVWQWKATSGGPTGWMDDDHFGPPVEPTPMQAKNADPYKGGFAPDPGTANYSNNFEGTTEAAGRAATMRPRRLPRDLVATLSGMGQLSLDADASEGDGARWFMTEAETMPYTEEVDRLIPFGTVIPGVIISGAYSGDRADVRCAARWASGHWALEVARRLDTGSEFDVPIKTGVFMRVAAFDHSQIEHTRHVRPIRLEME